MDNTSLAGASRGQARRRNARLLAVLAVLLLCNCHRHRCLLLLLLLAVVPQADKPEHVVPEQVLPLLLLCVLRHGILSEALAVGRLCLRVVVRDWLVVVQSRANIFLLIPGIILGGLHTQAEATQEEALTGLAGADNA